MSWKIGIQTALLWYRMQLLYHLCQSYFRYIFSNRILIDYKPFLFLLEVAK